KAEEFKQPKPKGQQQEPDGQQNQNNDGQEQKGNEQQRQGVVKRVDVGKNCVTLRFDGDREDQTLDLAKDVPVRVGGKTTSLRDLLDGTRVVASLSGNGRVVLALRGAKDEKSKGK